MHRKKDWARKIWCWKLLQIDYSLPDEIKLLTGSTDNEDNASILSTHNEKAKVTGKYFHLEKLKAIKKADRRQDD